MTTRPFTPEHNKAIQIAAERVLEEFLIPEKGEDNGLIQQEEPSSD